MTKLGIYKHYKGNYYRLLGATINTDSEELLLLYERLYTHPGEVRYFVKSEDEFNAKVEWEGSTIKRFELVEEA